MFGQTLSLSYAKISTLCLTLTGYTSFILLYKICRPFNRIRLFLFSSMFYLFIYAIFNLTTLFSITHFNTFMVFLTFLLMYLSHRLYNLFEVLVDKLIQKLSNKKEALTLIEKV